MSKSCGSVIAAAKELMKRNLEGFYSIFIKLWLRDVLSEAENKKWIDHRWEEINCGIF